MNDRKKYLINYKIKKEEIDMDKIEAKRLYDEGKKKGKLASDENSIANIGLGVGLGALLAGGVYVYSLINNAADDNSNPKPSAGDESKDEDFEKAYNNNKGGNNAK